MSTGLDSAATALRPLVHPADRAEALRLEPLVARAAAARIVMIGEASHGTADFYRVRAEITRRLIVEHGFDVIAIEGDWPDAYRANRYARGLGEDRSAVQALSGFERFPTWMWRNPVVIEFLEWLRSHNRTRPEPERAGFYGIDLYSLHRSMSEVIEYLAKREPQLAAEARELYACFDPFGPDPQAYGAATTWRAAEPCEDQVIDLLRTLQMRRTELLAHGGYAEADAFLCAEQNARVVRDAELYYRTMFHAGAASWNLRDEHMAATIVALDRHSAARGRAPKIVVWAHNSHLGDARATELSRRGELNLGQLMRDHYPGEAFSIGFSTYTGTVTAASTWDAPAQRMKVVPGLPGSWEALFHALGAPAFILLPGEAAAARVLGEPRLQRAIGVIYRPDTERQSHYFRADLRAQFDAMIHIDVTSALMPIEVRAPAGDEPAETFPTGL